MFWFASSWMKLFELVATCFILFFDVSSCVRLFLVVPVVSNC